MGKELKLFWGEKFFCILRFECAIPIKINAYVITSTFPYPRKELGLSCVKLKTIGGTFEYKNEGGP